MTEDKSAAKQSRLQSFMEVDIYPVTCEALSNQRSDLDVLDAVIEGGARIIQLRDKLSTIKNLYEKARRFRDITRNAGILLVINDHVDIAMAVDADGVHLGLEDFPLVEARKLLPDKIIGASTHTLREALMAQQNGADYINIGPIFPTKSKADADKFLGPDKIKGIAAHLTIPYTVMGGINSSNIDHVLAAGAQKVAMITGVTQAGNISKMVQKIRKKIRQRD